MTTPTETLRHEHQIILKVLDVAERLAERARQGAVDRAAIEQVLDFVRNFADRCHHAKEEKLLFVRMQHRGMPADTGPLACMLDEHEQGRSLIGRAAQSVAAAAAGDAAARRVVADALAGYAALLREHIWKEDNVLYPMGERLLTEQDQQELADAFARVEEEEMGAGTHERYHALAHDLEKV